MPNEPDFSTLQGWGQAGQKMMMNPLTLGGLGLMSGQGFKGMMEGMNGGQAMQKNQHELQQQQARDAYMQGLDPNDPRYKGLNPALVDLSKGMNDPGLLGKALTGKGDQDFQLQMLAKQGDIQAQLKLREMQGAQDLQRQGRQQDWDVWQKMRPSSPPSQPGIMGGNGQPSAPLVEGQRYKYQPGQGVQ